MAAYRLQNGGQKGLAYLDVSNSFLGVGAGGEERRKEEEEDSERKGDGSQPSICISEVCQMEGGVVRKVSLL